MDVITSHINADFDAFASMVAAKKLYPYAEIVFPGSQEKKLRDFIDAFRPVRIRRMREVDMAAVDRLIIVDANSPDRIGQFAEILEREGLKIHVYDHHRPVEGAIRGHLEVVEEAGATTTILAEILQRTKNHPTPMEATIMTLGIYEETGSLLFPSTTERDLRACAYLIRRGASLKIVSEFLRTGLNTEEIELLNELIQTSRQLVVHGIRVNIAKGSRESYVGDAAHLAHSMMEMGDTDALVIMLRMQDKVVLIGRSRAKELDMSAVMEEFGGGGHPTAAAATIKEIPLEILEEKVVEIINGAVRPTKNAGDVMTRPVITIGPKAAIKDAEETMTKYGVNVLPIVRDGKYAGIISREVVEKALFHGFSKNPVTELMTTDAATVEAVTPIREVERTMIEQNQRFMPVLKDGAITGAITRTDILRVMYEDFLRRTGIQDSDIEKTPSMGKNISRQIKNRFPKAIYDILRLSGEVAEGRRFGAYLVGGSVRDLLRGEENLDIDLVIEGDAIEFAKDLGARLGARVNAHERFGTARIKSGGLKFDVATARTEYYESPAALPKVETSSIKKDLYRRDFTINTLSVKLNPGEFGLLVDFFGGQRDLKEKTIRVLHNLSFVEDPTRAFRAVRFAERFGFKLSKHTENLIRSTIKMELFDKLSGSRLYEELVLTLRETEPPESVKRLAEYGLLSVIHPSLHFTEGLQALLGSIRDTLLWFDLSFIEEKPDKALSYIMGLLSALEGPDREAALKRLSVTTKAKGKIMKGISDAEGAVRKLPLGDPASVFELLSGIEPEGILLAMSMTEEETKKKEMSRYLLELRKMRPLIDGNDLKAMGVEQGPLYSKLLKTVLQEKLRGRLRSKEDEIRFVRDYLSPSTSCMS